MSPDDAAYAIATGGRSRSGEARASVHARMTELERAAGGKAAAARAAGVAPRTWRDWRAGKHAPSRLSAERLRGAVRRLRINSTRETKLRQFGTSAGGAISIKGRFRMSAEVRNRTVVLKPGNVPARAHGAPGRMVDALLRGDDAGAGAELQALVGAYQPGLGIESIERGSVK